MESDTPDLRVKVVKKLNSLSFEWATEKIVLTIEKGEINIIELDMWITDLLFNIHDKVELRKKLLGGNDSSFIAK